MKRITNCGVLGGYITVEATRRDAWRGFSLGFLAAVTMTMVLVKLTLYLLTYTEVTINGATAGIYLVVMVPIWVNLTGFACLWGIAGSLVFEQLRLAIRNRDMLNGREFKHKSLVLMARRELAVIGYG